MEKKQSSVEWFALWVCNNTVCKPEEIKKAYQEAKAMHREEIERALSEFPCSNEDAEKYYNETFGDAAP